MEKKRQNNIPHDIAINRLYSILVFFANIFSIYIAKKAFTHGILDKKVGTFVLLTAILIDVLFYNIIQNYSKLKKRRKRGF